MDEKNNALSIRKEDILEVSFLNQNGQGAIKPFTRDILLLDTMINGAMHTEDIYEKAAKLKVGDRVELVLEPDNIYDPMAILVKTEDHQKLGYIPRVKNEVLYHLMDAGKYLYGVVYDGDIGEKLDPEDSWIEIYIDVYMVD